MWLLKQDVLTQMRHVYESGLAPTSEQKAELLARHEEQAAALSAPRNLRIAGATAEIRVEGILTQKPDIIAMILGMGNTTYQQIQSAISIVESDSTIKNVSYFFATPGGTVAGAFETLAAIEAAKKPATVRAEMATSAGYLLAAAAGKIEAVTPASEFGSIGVVQSFFADDQVIEITSTEAPNKRPDISTEEGQAVVREYLDAIHQLFVEAIARGRGVSVAQVNAEFGRGSLLLAGEARRRGMIDRIAKPALRSVTIDQPETEFSKPADGGQAKLEKNMDKNELKEKHPQLFAAVLQEGAEAAVKTERDRVSAHLVFGEQSGDMKTAIEAVKSGDEVTQTIMAKYMTAGMNKSSIASREADEKVTGAALEGAELNSETDAPDLGDQVWAKMQEMNGVKSQKGAIANG